MSAADTPAGPALTGEVPGWLKGIFFLSGGAALIYQVAWQRALFGIFGLNIESVTVIVTAFMLGLGLGSLAGGALSRAPERPLLAWFAAIELAIGAFGAISLELFGRVGAATLHLPAAGTAAVTFALVLLPTLGMGATLPLLVAWAVRVSGNVGRSVGLLYFVNTLGSAAAAMLTAIVLLKALGLQGAVALAAGVNGFIGLAVGLQHLRGRGQPSHPQVTP